MGGWWNRQFNPEVDLVGADRGPVADEISYVGSVKWLGSCFDGHDLAELRSAAAQVPGLVPGRTGLVAVSLSGVELSPAERGQLQLVWGPDEVVGAFKTPH